MYGLQPHYATLVFTWQSWIIASLHTSHKIFIFLHCFYTSIFVTLNHKSFL
jgi:hypothetical protein